MLLYLVLAALTKNTARVKKMEKLYMGGENNRMTKKQIHNLTTRTTIQTVCIIILFLGLVALAIIHFLNVPLPSDQTNGKLTPKMQQMFNESENRVQNLSDQYEVIILQMNQTIEKLQGKLANHTQTEFDERIKSENILKAELNSSLKELFDEVLQNQHNISQINNLTLPQVSSLQTDLEEIWMKLKNHDDQFTVVNSRITPLQKNIVDFRQELSKTNAKIDDNRNNTHRKIQKIENELKTQDHNYQNETRTFRNDIRKKLKKAVDSMSSQSDILKANVSRTNLLLHQIQQNMTNSDDLQNITVAVNLLHNRITGNISNYLETLTHRNSLTEESMRNLSFTAGELKRSSDITSNLLKNLEESLMALEETTLNNIMAELNKTANATTVNKKSFTLLRNNLTHHIRKDLDQVQKLAADLQRNFTKTHTTLDRVVMEVQKLSVNSSATNEKLFDLKRNLEQRFAGDQEPGPLDDYSDRR